MKTYNPPKPVEIVREIRRFDGVKGADSYAEYEVTPVDLLKYDDNGIVYLQAGRKCFMPYSSLFVVQEKEIK